MPKTYLVRKEWVSTCYIYEMLVTPELVAHYNKYINDNYSFKDVDKIELTEQDLAQAWDGYWNENNLLDTEVTAYGDYVYNFSLALGDIVQELLNEEMWEQDCDQDNTHTEDIEDYFYTVPTNDEN